MCLHTNTLISLPYYSYIFIIFLPDFTVLCRSFFCNTKVQANAKKHTQAYKRLYSILWFWCEKVWSNDLEKLIHDLKTKKILQNNHIKSNHLYLLVPFVFDTYPIDT